jgi:hypothetical protein
VPLGSRQSGASYAPQHEVGGLDACKEAAGSCPAVFGREGCTWAVLTGGADARVLCGGHVVLFLG